MFTTQCTVDNKSNRKRWRLAKVALGCAATLVALAPLAVAQFGTGDSQGDSTAPIEGTWILSIHRVVTGINFTALQSFTAGGVTLATGTLDRTAMPPSPPLPPYTSAMSPLYGSWKQTDQNTYVATINFFVFDSAGTAQAMIKNNETIRFIGNNSIFGSGTGFACDTNGDNCGIVPAVSITFTGKRLIAQGSSN
jgi:hypothetical protein